MRGIGKHNPPVQHQREPRDNTSPYIERQVDVFFDSGVHVHPEVAREIAAWWQGPVGSGYPFAAFQSSGIILPDFSDALWTEVRAAWRQVENREEWDTEAATALKALVALMAYVRQAEMTI